MPKFETINTTLEDGAQFNKFIKYLPYQNYLPKELEIVKVAKDGEEIDKSKWQEILKGAVEGMTKVEPTLEEKYTEEKKRNEELNERLERLEKLLSEPKEVASDESIEAIREEYFKKVGKKAYHGWDIETLKQKINE